MRIEHYYLQVAFGGDRYDDAYYNEKRYFPWDEVIDILSEPIVMHDMPDYGDIVEIRRGNAILRIKVEMNDIYAFCRGDLSDPKSPKSFVLRNKMFEFDGLPMYRLILAVLQSSTISKVRDSFLDVLQKKIFEISNNVR